MWKEIDPSPKIQSLIQQSLNIDNPTILSFETDASTNPVYKIQSDPNDIILKYQENPNKNVQQDLDAVITAQRKFNTSILKYIPTIFDYGTTKEDEYCYLFCEELPGTEILIEDYPEEQQKKIANEIGYFLGHLHNQEINTTGCGKITTNELQTKYPTQIDFFNARLQNYQNMVDKQRFNNKLLTHLKKFINKADVSQDTSKRIIHIEDFTTTNTVFDEETFELNGFIDWDWIIRCTQSFALVNVWYRCIRYNNISLQQKRTLWDELWNGYSQTRSNPGKQPKLSNPYIKAYIAFNIFDEISDYDKWNRGKTDKEKQAQKDELYRIVRCLTQT